MVFRMAARGISRSSGYGAVSERGAVDIPQTLFVGDGIVVEKVIGGRFYVSILYMRASILSIGIGVWLRHYKWRFN